jgi:hypothetical protein
MDCKATGLQCIVQGMVGFASKRIMSVERHCDPVTMDHIIELRKQLKEAERQRDNALDRCVYLDKVLWKLREEILMLANGKSNDDERNC